MNWSIISIYVVLVKQKREPFDAKELPFGPRVVMMIEI